ncbi:uncharacterized protein LOC133206236 [Saccostrea echinata]|uniref:uncharacterized protein LOC133206236 n=1 Tax=Saccostrea echinata TaxID=191078 RepID=UPI002A819D18|nr:uncharacterized protein LOC133206236 [Saccostrea echinata]
MATAGGIKKPKSATTKQCAICEARVDVKWRCTNCDKIICQNCKNLHKKVRATSHHKIVSIVRKIRKESKGDDNASEIGSNENHDDGGSSSDKTMPKSSRPSVMCLKHNDSVLKWYCSSCKSAVCQECAKSDHKSHVMADLSVYQDRKQKKWERFLKVLEDKELPETMQRMKRIKKAKMDFDANIIAVKREVWMRYDEFMLKLGNERQKILSELDEIQHREEKVFSDALKNMEREITVLESSIDSTTGMIDSLNTQSIWDNFEDVRTEVEKIKKTLYPNPEKVTFNAPEVTEKIVSHLYGKLERRLDEAPFLPPSRSDLSGLLTPGVDVSLLSSFATDLPFIRTICPVSSEEAWIGCWQHDQMFLSSSSGQVSQTVTAKAMDMSVMDNGDLLVVCYLSYNLQCIKKNGKLKELKSDLPLYPTGIIAMSNGDIIVSLVDRYDLKIDENSIRRLMKFDRDGNILLIVENDVNGRAIFTYPAKVTVNINGDICAIDETGEYSGRLVVFDSAGELKFEYGELDSTFEETCDLSSCACSADGRIVATDWLHHKIHILTADGCFIGYLMTEDDGIHFPFCCAFGPDGVLWIGCKLSKEAAKGDIVRVNYKC